MIKKTLQKFLKKQITEERQIWYLPKYIVLEEFKSRKYLLLTTSCICGLIILLLLWASFAVVDEKAITQGELIPIGRVKIIQHLEGGIVESILVKNDASITKGQPVIQLNSTNYKTELKQLQAKQTALKIDAQRLQAFINYEHSLNNKSNVNQTTTDKEELLIEEDQLLSIQNKARQNQLSVLQAQINSQKEEVTRLVDQIALTKDNLKLLNQEVTMYEKLEANGYVSKKDYLQALRARNNGDIELTSLQQKLKQAQQKLIELTDSKESTDSSLHEDASKQLDDIRSKLQEITYQIQNIEDKVERTTIIAPISGVIKGLEVTIGQVVPPGGEVFSIVPQDEQLQAEVKIQPKDIGHIQVGNSVNVKLMAYDYSRYGSITGILTAISPTSFKDNQGNPYYKGIIALDQQYVYKTKNKLKAGMTVEADIITDNKTVIQYLLKPIRKTFESSFYES